MRGVPVWATLLALEVEGAVDVAVVSAPALGAALVGDARRRRVRRRRAAARSPRIAALEDATVSATSARSLPAGWAELARRAWAARGWADFWQHCLVAEGAIELAVENGLKIWDYAAISLVVEEAGGR